MMVTYKRLQTLAVLLNNYNFIAYKNSGVNRGSHPYVKYG